MRGEANDGAGVGVTGQTVETLTAANALSALEHEHRRIILQELEAESEATVDELAEAITGVERTSVDVREHERIKLDLHHRHLPKLSAVGLIDYDGGGGTVAYEADERIGRLLRLIDEEW